MAPCSGELASPQSRLIALGFKITFYLSNFVVIIDDIQCILYSDSAIEKFDLPTK